MCSWLSVNYGAIEMTTIIIYGTPSCKSPEHIQRPCSFYHTHAHMYAHTCVHTHTYDSTGAIMHTFTPPPSFFPLATSSFLLHVICLFSAWKKGTTMKSCPCFIIYKKWHSPKTLGYIILFQPMFSISFVWLPFFFSSPYFDFSFVLHCVCVCVCAFP